MPGGTHTLRAATADHRTHIIIRFARRAPLPEHHGAWAGSVFYAVAGLPPAIPGHDTGEDDVTRHRVTLPQIPLGDGDGDRARRRARNGGPRSPAGLARRPR